MFFCCCGLLICLLVLTQKEKLEVPHREVMLCARSSGDGLKWQMKAVFNLHYLLSLLRRPRLHMKSFPKLFQILSPCKLKIQLYTWKEMSAGTHLLFSLSSTKVDETVSVILFLPLKETINQIIPNMIKKQCKWMENNRYSKEQPWLFFKGEIVKKWETDGWKW